MMNLKLLHLSDTHRNHYSLTKSINQQKAEVFLFFDDMVFVLF